jgi:hypothetical protein
VRGVVVQDQEYVEVFGDLLVDLDEELLELLGPVALAKRPDHLSGRHVQGGEQGGGAVTYVVVTGAFGDAWCRRFAQYFSRP